MITVLLAIIASLGGFGIFTWLKKNSAEALNQNVDIKNQVNKLDSQVAENQGTLDAEAQKRSQAEELVKKQQAVKDSIQDLTAFLNRKPGE